MEPWSTSSFHWPSKVLCRKLQLLWVHVCDSYAMSKALSLSCPQGIIYFPPCLPCCFRASVEGDDMHVLCVERSELISPRTLNSSDSVLACAQDSEKLFWLRLGTPQIYWCKCIYLESGSLMLPIRKTVWRCSLLSCDLPDYGFLPCVQYQAWNWVTSLILKLWTERW